MTSQRGVVARFDDHVGLGAVVDGASEWEFHCTAIASGSRTIDAGTDVTFTVRPTHRGMLEAFDLRPT